MKWNTILQHALTAAVTGSIVFGTTMLSVARAVDQQGIEIQHLVKADADTRNELLAVKNDFQVSSDRMAAVFQKTADRMAASIDRLIDQNTTLIAFLKAQQTMKANAAVSIP